MKFLGLSKGQNVVDVGAHIGAFTVLAANLVGPEGRVVSFEPSTDNYLLFDRNLRANRIGNVIPFKVAIGSEAGFKQLHIYDKMASNSFFQRPDRKELRSETAQVRTLDSFMDGLMPPRVHAVKINVEGFETEVLMGARKLIERDAPRLVVMAHSFAESHDKVRAILVSFGYEVKEGRTADTLMASPSDRKAA
jgi:FkbM family methyltransferase